MNSPDDTDLEARLARLRPASLPNDYSRRLHAAEPPTRCAAEGGRRPPGAVDFLRNTVASLLRPWPVAYAGLLAAWLLILTLRLATPSPSVGPVLPSSLAHHPEPTSLGHLSWDRAALLTRNSPPDLWP